MRKTSDLIDALVESATPVRRLRPPLLRAGIWLVLAAAVLGLLCLAHGVRPDIAARLRQPVFIVSMAGTLATAILAALASFELSLPDTSQRWLLLPLPALVVWVSTIGIGCLTDWASIGADGMRMGEAARCFATLLLTSVPLSIALLIMLRHAAALRPTAVSAAGGLAIAAVASFALALIHDLDATIMILIWNLGMAVLVAGLAGAFGRSALKWVAAHLMPSLPTQPSSRR